MAVSIRYLASRLSRAACPPDFCSRNNRPGRPAFSFDQRVRQRLGDSFLPPGPEKAADQEPPAARDQKQPQQSEFLMRLAMNPGPERIECPFGRFATMGNLTYPQFRGCDGHLLVSLGGAIIGANRPVE